MGDPLKYYPHRLFPAQRTPFTFQYTHTAAPAGVGIASGTSTTFSAVDIGAQAYNRVVVVVATANTGDPYTSVTIGGITATEAVVDWGVVVSGLGIFYAVVPNETTADIVINTTATSHDVAIVVGMFYHGASTTPYHTTSSHTPIDATQNSKTMNTNIPAGGFAIAATCHQHVQQTPTWTNTTSVTGDAITQITDGSLTDTLYVAHSTTEGSPTAIGWAVPDPDWLHSVSASWGP